MEVWTRLSSSIVARLLAAVVLGVVLLLPHAPALAQGKRVALVVGNSAYAHVPPLANPENDAADVASALQALNFQVLVGRNLSKPAFERLLRDFGEAAAGAETAFLFYAGHGLQAKGVNYLMPVDADIRAERDLDFTAISLDLALKQVREAQTRIVMLDACRNNPFARSLSRSMGTRAVDENLGLAVTVASDLGTFIAYATQPGNVASDGKGRNSPFTEKLKAHLATPGQSITDLMMVVRNEVAMATNGAQIPWEHSALAQKFYFRPGTPSMPDARSQKESEAAEAWGWISRSASTALLVEFIRRYGDTPFAGQARNALAALQAKPAGTPKNAVPNIASISLRPV
ncbi:MAG: caspase domain-containing protein, partial [Hyphomicrobiaceae bacterium]